MDQLQSDDQNMGGSQIENFTCSLLICEQDHVSCVIRVDCSGCYKVEVEDQIDISRDLPQSYKMLVEFLRLDNFLC